MMRFGAPDVFGFPEVGPAMLAVGTGGKGRTRPPVAAEGACAWAYADADLTPSDDPNTLASAALADERNKCRRFITTPPKHPDPITKQDLTPFRTPEICRA
jgi:hypothetical protein